MRPIAKAHERAKTYERGFYAGMLCALAVVADFDEETIFDHIVASSGEEELVSAARRGGSMRRSGLTRYGYGKRYPPPGPTHLEGEATLRNGNEPPLAPPQAPESRPSGASLCPLPK